MIKIYALIDPISEEIRYVGQTYRSLEIRLKEHIYDCIRRPRSSHKVNWLSNLILNNTLPKIKLLEVVTNETHLEKEKEWILKLINDGCNLTNSTEGGEFCHKGSSLTEDIRKHLSNKAKERIERDGNIMYGKKHKDSSRKKMSDKKKGLYDGVKNPRSKEIFEYDDQGNFIRKWSYCKECAIHHGISRGNLSNFAKYNTNIEESDKPIVFKKLKGLIFKFI